MTEIFTPVPAKGFNYSTAPQRSPEWNSIRAPRIGASEIGKYMAKGKNGQYLVGRKEVEKKIAFSKAFGVPMENFVNGAMQAGIDNEDFVADEYAKQTGKELATVGCAYNEWFVASPDRAIVGENGGVEIKWLFDNEFAELLLTGFPKDLHYDQMQGQMWAFGWDFVDYVAGNGNTGKFYIVRVKRNDKRIEEIADEEESVLAIEPMTTTDVHSFSSEQPIKEQGDVWND
jgi:predicted phage-related endonuclease